MTLLHRLVSIARWILRREHSERDLDAELQAFIDLSAADKTREGVVAPADARRLAVLEIGEWNRSRSASGLAGTAGRSTRSGATSATPFACSPGIPGSAPSSS